VLPRDPREVSRAEVGRLLADVLMEIEEEQERAKLAAKASRERIADLRARAKGIRDYLRGKAGSQPPLPMDTSPVRIVPPREDA
jgi:hypothetical protein